MSSPHDHDHEHHHHHEGHDGHEHDHEVPLNSGPNDSLFTQIDTLNVTALNAEGGAAAGQKVIK